MAGTAYYGRVSTTKQDPDRQVEMIRGHLGEEKFREARAYVDVGSGARDDREEFQRLISDIESGLVDEVHTVEVSRLSRRLSTAADFIDLCVEHEVSLTTLADSFPDLKGDGDVFDKLMGQLTAWMMEYEREMIRERVQSGVTRAIERGKWVGRPPYGFETDSEGYLQVKPDDYTAMQTAIEMAQDPTNDESVNAIARACNVPQSTLNRTLKDDEKLALYVDGEADDDRLASALDD